MRKGSWIDAFGIEVVPFEQRDAADRGRFTDGPLYRVKDIFTTRDGSWELSAAPGGIDAWARDEYWQGAKFDGAGGATHFFVKVLDVNGNPMPGKGILFSEGGMSGAWQPTTAIRQAKADGSENIPLNGSDYVPARNEHGAWLATTIGRADIVRYVGLPYGTIAAADNLPRGAWHISTFVVLQATTESAPPVEPPVEPPPTGSGDMIAAFDRLTAQVKRIADYLTR